MTPNPTLVPAGQGSEYHDLLKVITNTQSNSYFGAFDPKQLAGRQSPVIREARPRRVRARAQFAYGGRVMGGWVYGVSERPGTSAEHYLSVLARPDIPATNDLARAMQRASLADWTAYAASVLVETMKAGDTVIPLTQAPTARHYVLTSAPNSIAAERLDPVRDEQANGGPSYEIERQYEQRMAELDEAADDEGITVFDRSRDDFWCFVRERLSWPHADVILTDNGNFVAVWYREDESEVEVEFLGDQKCRLIIFGDPSASPVVLPDIIDGDLVTVGERIRDFSFMHIEE